MTFIIHGQDNFSNFRGRAKVPCCPNPSCQTILDPFSFPFPGKVRPRDDLTCIASEGLSLASPHLIEFLVEHCTTRIDTFETGGGYFVLRPSNALFLDLSRCSLHLGEICSTCGRNPVMLRSSGRPSILRGQEVSPFGLYRTVQEFGNFNQRRFDLIAGDGLAESLRSSGLKGIVFSELYRRN
jgi:hypothetical protein